MGSELPQSFAAAAAAGGPGVIGLPHSPVFPEPPVAAMSSPSSGEQYEEEDAAYESQAKRLKPSAAAEEGEIEYGAEEGDSRREKAAPRSGGFSGGVRQAPLERSRP